MKVTLLSIFSIIISISALAQQPFGMNATWYYDYNEYGYYGLKKVEYEKDTTMLNMTWQKFSVSGIKELKTGPNWYDISQDTNAVWDPIFLATRNDSVFRLDSNTPVLLYDLSAQAGDSWTIAPYDSTFGCTDSNTVTVDSVFQTGIINNGPIVDAMYLSYPSDTSNQPTSSAVLSNYLFVDFGATSYSELFAPYRNTCDSTPITFNYHGLRCFQNGQINVNFRLYACDSWSYITVDEELPNALSVFPNPSKGRIYIDIPSQFDTGGDIEVYNIHGQLIQSESIEHTGITSIQLGTTGMFIIKVIAENQSASISERVVVH